MRMKAEGGKIFGVRRAICALRCRVAPFSEGEGRMKMKKLKGE